MTEAAAPPAATVGGLLLRAARLWPERDAVVFPERRATYRELAEGARRVARGLHALGVRPGEHVGVLLPNCLEIVEALFGIALAGAVACPVNARYRSEELGHLVVDADHVVLLTTDLIDEHVDFAALLHAALPGLAEAQPERLELACAPRLRQVVMLGRRDPPGFLGRARLEELADGVPDEEVDGVQAGVTARDVALVLTTSGTTARPKGCLITHDAIVRGSCAVGERFRVTEDDVCWDPLPLFHTSGIQPLLFTVAGGGRFVSMTHVDSDAGLRQIREEGATLVLATFPPIMLGLVHHPDFPQLDTSRVRVATCVAPPDTLREIQAAFPHAAQAGAYGLCEGGGYLSVNELDEEDELRLTTVGPPFPGVEIRVVDTDGVDLPPGTPGELLVRGTTLFSGYYRDPQRTAEVVDAEGWLHTGDRGSLDAAGRISFLGRIKELIRVGGENVAPAEIESYLSTHPAVHLVQAVGVPDPALDEVPAVFVELKPGASATEQELVDHCRGRIASFKVPRYVRIVEEWPMSATKIQRFRLRERLLAELGHPERPR